VTAPQSIRNRVRDAQAAYRTACSLRLTAEKELNESAWRYLTDSGWAPVDFSGSQWAAPESRGSAVYRRLRAVEVQQGWDAVGAAQEVER